MPSDGCDGPDRTGPHSRGSGSRGPDGVTPGVGRRNRAGPRRDLHDAAVLHHHAARVARQALGRFRGNAHAVIENGLAGCIRVRQHRGVDMDDDLISLAWGARVDAVAERRFGEQGSQDWHSVVVADAKSLPAGMLSSVVYERHPAHGTRSRSLACRPCRERTVSSRRQALVHAVHVGAVEAGHVVGGRQRLRVEERRQLVVLLCEAGPPVELRL